MARTKISEFSSTPGSNTDIDGINIAENCAPSGINDAIRELMAQLKNFQTGAAGDSFNGPVGTTTPVAGAFTTLSASGAVTLSGGTANGIPYLNDSKVLTSGSALTFDGTNLGVGETSPQAYLHIRATSGLTPQIKLGGNAAYQLQLGYNNSAEYGFLQAYAANLSTPDDIVINPSGGNLGLGVIPSAWSAGKAFEVKSAGTGIFNNAVDETYYTNNAYYNGGWKYGGTGYAEQYIQYAGQHRWYTAPSGTAGNAISFSQSMTLDTSGNLLVGTTSDSTVTLATGILSKSSGGTNFIAQHTAGSGTAFRFYTSTSTLAGAINTSGNTTAYTSISDYRLKENIKPLKNALEKVAQLKPVSYTFINNDQPSQGFIAHELQAVVPECVTGEMNAVDADGNPVYQGVDTSFLVATLTAAIQEQQAIIDNLTQRLAALESK